ncbi:hypothetical protein [Streptomyces griseorubiginosus]|uniref:hypothetical protein n=1 Tax=Streptomyces griseorubiginosus TaxID=67304 RepID=UPI0033E5E79D
MGENATALQTSLDRLLESPGVTGVALIDAVTGLVYGAAGDIGETGGGAESSELAALIAQRLGEAGAEGDLESVVLTSRRRHQMLFSVVRPAGDPLLLAAALDRDRANMALALRSLGDRVTEVLA